MKFCFRSSRPEVFCKKCVYLRLVPKTLAQVFFSVNFSKFLRTPFFIEHLWSLFLLLLAYLIKLVHLWIIRVRIKRFDSFLSIGYCNVFVWNFVHFVKAIVFFVIHLIVTQIFYPDLPGEIYFPFELFWDSSNFNCL